MCRSASNTLDAHRLIHWGDRGAASAVVSALPRLLEAATSATGVLADIAGAAGLDREATARLLASDADAGDIAARDGRPGQGSSRPHLADRPALRRLRLTAFRAVGAGDRKDLKESPMTDHIPSDARACRRRSSRDRDALRHHRLFHRRDAAGEPAIAAAFTPTTRTGPSWWWGRQLPGMIAPSVVPCRRLRPQAGDDLGQGDLFLAALICIFAQSLEVLLAARVLQGIGGAGRGPSRWPWCAPQGSRWRISCPSP